MYLWLQFVKAVAANKLWKEPRQGGGGVQNSLPSWSSIFGISSNVKQIAGFCAWPVPVLCEVGAVWWCFYLPASDKAELLASRVDVNICPTAAFWGIRQLRFPDTDVVSVTFLAAVKKCSTGATAGRRGWYNEQSEDVVHHGKDAVALTGL